jgi:hypothetical protein
LDDYQLNLSMTKKMERTLDGAGDMYNRPDAPRPEDMPELTVKWQRNLYEPQDAPNLEDSP